MLVESFLGVDEQTIVRDPSDFLPEWKSRFEQHDSQFAINALLTFYKGLDQIFRSMVNAGKAAFTSSAARTVVDGNANMLASMQAFNETFDANQMKSKYPAEIQQIAQYQSSINASLEMLKEFNPGIGDAQSDYYQARDKAIESGDLDSPLVHPDLKQQVLNIAYTKPEQLMPGLADKLKSTYDQTGASLTSEVPKTNVKTIALVALAGIAAWYALKG